MLNKVYKKGQSAVEFMILIGTVIFFFVLFFVSINESIGDKVSERKNIAIKEIASSVQDEINIALKSSDGYSRQFKVPYDINGAEYKINITGEMVYVRTSDNKYAIALPVPAMTGHIIKGDNLIKKEAGQVYLNP
jgi:hypothetical protein